MKIFGKKVGFKNISKVWLVSIVLLLLFACAAIFVTAGYTKTEQSSFTFTQSGEKQEFVRAKVLKVVNSFAEDDSINQNIRVILLEGDDKNKELDLTYGIARTVPKSRWFEENNTIYLLKEKNPITQSITYRPFDKERLGVIWIVLSIFTVLVIAVAWRRGVGALLSLILSVGVVVWILMPLLENGFNVVWATVFAAICIGTINMFLGHGWNKSSRIAWLGTMLTLLFIAIICSWVVNIGELSGFGTEEGRLLQASNFGNINLIGLIIGAVVIASIGVLDDVTASQANIVKELKRANPSLSRFELFKRSMRVGREHISSMVNSLILVYIGSSFATFLVAFGSTELPLLVSLNREGIIVEIVSSLVSCIGLVLAVPVTSFIASYEE